MTVCGFDIAPGGASAIAWTDSETFRDGRPAGHAAKIAVNPFAGTLVLGSGNILMLFELGDLVLRCTSFDELLEQMPAQLLRAVSASRACGSEGRAPSNWRYGALGFSHRWGRIVGARIEQGRDFAPDLVSEFASPQVDAARGVSEMSGAIVAAQAQIALLQRTYPKATGGALTVVELGRDGIRCRPLFDLAHGVFLRRGFVGEARRPQLEAPPARLVNRASDREEHPEPAAVESMASSAAGTFHCENHDGE